MSDPKMPDVELRKLAEAATPGPWMVQQYSTHVGFSVWADGRGCIAERWYDITQAKPYGDEIGGNAAFIAAANPAAVLSLLDRLDAAEARVRALEGTLDEERRKTFSMLFEGDLAGKDKTI